MSNTLSRTFPRLRHLPLTFCSLTISFILTAHLTHEFLHPILTKKQSQIITELPLYFTSCPTFNSHMLQVCNPTD